MIDPQVAFEKLAQFQTTNELVNFFECEGVVGTKRSAYSCPIANYISSLVDGSVSVGGVSMNANNTRFDLTNAMIDFINGFDTGEFPWLVDTSDL